MAERNVEECSICMEEFNHLKILQCDHVFCVNCIHTLLGKDDNDEEDDDQDDDQVTCPFDQEVTTLPGGKAANLKTKFFTNLNCESCCMGKSINESWWCETCGCTICGDCAMKKHRNHDCNEWNVFGIVKECYAFYKLQKPPGEVNWTESRDSIQKFCNKLRDNLLNHVNELECVERAITDMKNVFGNIENVDFEEGHTIKMKDKKFNAVSKLLQTKPGIPELPQITTNESTNTFYLYSIELLIGFFFTSEYLSTINREKHPIPFTETDERSLLEEIRRVMTKALDEPLSFREIFTNLNSESSYTLKNNETLSKHIKTEGLEKQRAELKKYTNIKQSSQDNQTTTQFFCDLYYKKTVLSQNN